MNLADLQKVAGRWVTGPLMPILAKTNIQPDVLTWVGLAISISAAWAIAANRLVLGGILVLVAAVFDLFDGALARYTEKTTNFGAFLDSTFDRLSESIIIIGIVIHYLFLGERILQIGAISIGNETSIGIILAFAVLIFSFLTSYTRARAEGLGLDCNVGLFTRAGRVILLALGLLIDQLLIMLFIIAVLSAITVIQRVAYTWQRISKQKKDG